MRLGLYDRCILPRLTHLVMRNRRLAAYRQRAVARARGEVLEIGMGSGLNFAFYGQDIRRVVGVDPSVPLVRLARQEARKRRFPLEVLIGSAEDLPLPESSVDTAVTTWSLCTIPDPLKALREVRRVLRHTPHHLGRVVSRPRRLITSNRLPLPLYPDIFPVIEGRLGMGSNPSQKRALQNYRHRLSKRGMARFEVLGLNGDRELIRSLAKRLAQNDAEAARIRALVSRTVAGQPPGKGGILAALRRSPLVGADLDLKPSYETGRKIDL